MIEYKYPVMERGGRMDYQIGKNMFGNTNVGGGVQMNAQNGESNSSIL